MVARAIFASIAASRSASTRASQSRLTSRSRARSRASAEVADGDGPPALAPPGVEGGEALEDLVALGPERGDLGGQRPRPLGPEGLQLGGPFLQLGPGGVDRLLHLAEPGLGRLWRRRLLGLEDFGQEGVGRPGRLVEQGPGLLQLRLELGRLALGAALGVLGLGPLLVDLLPVLEQR